MNKKTYLAIQRKVRKAGGAQKVGVLLGDKMGRKRPYTRQAVSNWCSKQPIPPKLVIELEGILGLTRAQMRPDLWD